MHRRVALLSILTLTAGGALLPAGLAQAQSGPKPAQKAAADSTSEQKAVLQYWTPQKMETAQPLDAPAPKKQAKPAMGAPGEPTTVTPWTAPPTSAPGSA